MARNQTAEQLRRDLNLFLGGPECDIDGWKQTTLPQRLNLLYRFLCGRTPFNSSMPMLGRWFSVNYDRFDCRAFAQPTSCPNYRPEDLTDIVAPLESELLKGVGYRNLGTGSPSV